MFIPLFFSRRCEIDRGETAGHITILKSSHLPTRFEPVVVAVGEQNMHLFHSSRKRGGNCSGSGRERYTGRVEVGIILHRVFKAYCTDTCLKAVVVTHVSCNMYCLDRGRFGYGYCGCHLSVLLRYSTFTFGFKIVSGCASIVWIPSGLMWPQGLC